MFDSTWTFLVDFDVTNGVVFRRKHPALLTTIGEMLSVVDINADIRNQHDDIGLKAKVTITSAGPLN